MYKSKNDDLTYITSFGSETRKNEEKNIMDIPKFSSSLRRINNYKSIENQPLIQNKKLFSIKFPLIQQHKENLISVLFDSNYKSLNKIQKPNLLNDSHKNNKRIDLMISKIKKGNKSINKRNKYIQIKFNSHSIDKSLKKDKFKTINTSPIKKEINKKSFIHNAQSAKNLKSIFINNIEFNQNIQNESRNYLSPKSSLNYLINSYSSRSQKIKSISGNKKKFKTILDEFSKKEKILESSKKQLYVYSLKQFSPRLLRKKDKNENMKKDIYTYRNNNDNKYKIQNMIFKNKLIPYVDRIDIRKITTQLPPLVLGCRYIIPKKSEEIIKRREFNEAVDKIIKESKQKKQKKQLNLTKKEILKRVRNRNLQFCRNRIHETEEDVFIKRNKIITDYNALKLSLNQFDNWNSPENVDNLFS